MIKTNWFIILFMFIGYFSFVSFGQGQDMLRNLGLTEGPEILRQTLFVYIAVGWWSWQSFRASRVSLHFSYFNFWSYQPAYSLQAQVLVPRVLATIPFLIIGYGIYKAHGHSTPMVTIMVSSAIWAMVFLYFRKAMIVWIRARKLSINALIPVYIPIKNGTYPAKFIWSKQRRWIIFRLAVLVGTFVGLFLFPVDLTQYIGATAIVLFAFGCWLILVALAMFVEKYLKIPVAISVLVCLVLFSFVNNNHEIRTLSGKITQRPNISSHFNHWVHQRQNGNDTLDIYLVMAEGGGMRSAYWTSGVLRTLSEHNPEVADNLYAFSGVSGGAFGSTLITCLMDQTDEVSSQSTQTILQKDFLAPVTAALTFGDMLQNFIPFPIPKLDRMRSLERSWEEAWIESRPPDNKLSWGDGFLETFANDNSPLLLLNSTHVESGLRAVVSNVDLSELKGSHMKDFFNITQYDIPISTAIGLSSRFPILTPPALVKGSDGKVWGSLVDGGYYENLGARTMFDVYALLKEICRKNGHLVRFNLIAIRNTKFNDSEEPVNGMYELISPVITFSNIWANTGVEVLKDAKSFIEGDGNKLHEVNLMREEEENIPLGWYLSKTARDQIDQQLEQVKLSLH